jgi:hypothetical protein
LATSPAALSDEQRRALAEADAGRWRIYVEMPDGTRVLLRLGHPAYTLVLALGERPDDDDPSLYRRAA